MPPIIAVTHEFYPTRGGIATYIEELAKATQAQNDVEVWAPNHPKLDPSEYTFSLKTLPAKGTQGPLDVWSTAKQIRAHCPTASCLYIAEPGPLLACILLHQLGRLPNAKLVLTLHGSEIIKCLNRPWLKPGFLRLLEKAHRIGCVSHYTASLLGEHFNALEHKICIVPGALKQDLADNPPPLKPHANTSSTFRILTVARIHPRKGQLAMLEAIAMLPEQLKSKIQYTIAGPIVQPKYAKKLQRFADEHGIQAILTGKVSHSGLNQLYQDADVFAMTSDATPNSVEGYGLVYLEAGVHSLASLAHAIGGVPEAVKHEATGLLASPHSRNELCDHLKTVIEKPEFCYTMGCNARDHALSRNWKTIAQQLFDL